MYSDVLEKVCSQGTDGDKSQLGCKEDVPGPSASPGAAAAAADTADADEFQAFLNAINDSQLGSTLMGSHGDEQPPHDFDDAELLALSEKHQHDSDAALARALAASEKEYADMAAQAAADGGARDMRPAGMQVGFARVCQLHVGACDHNAQHSCDAQAQMCAQLPFVPPGMPCCIRCMRMMCTRTSCMRMWLLHDTGARPVVVRGVAAAEHQMS